MSLLELFVEVDDFCQAFELWAAKQQLPDKAKRGSKPVLSSSEVMTIVIHFHQAGYRSSANFAVNLLAGLIAYTHQPKKPSLRMPSEPEQLLALL